MSALHRSPVSAKSTANEYVSAGTGAEADAESPEPIDQDLLQRATREDRAAWQTLYKLFNTRFTELAARCVFKHAGWQGARRQVVDELVQALWAHLLEDSQRIAGQFNPDRGTLSAFMTTVARNYITDLLRQRRGPWSREVELDENVEPEETLASPEDQAAEREQLNKLAHVVGRMLPPKDRELLLRVCVHDESTATIAEEEGKPRNTVDQQLTRARAKVRELARKLGIRDQE